MSAINRKQFDFHKTTNAAFLFLEFAEGFLFFSDTEKNLKSENVLRDAPRNDKQKKLDLCNGKI